MALRLDPRHGVALKMAMSCGCGACGCKTRGDCYVRGHGCCYGPARPCGEDTRPIMLVRV